MRIYNDKTGRFENIGETDQTAQQFDDQDLHCIHYRFYLKNSDRYIN